MAIANLTNVKSDNELNTWLSQLRNNGDLAAVAFHHLYSAAHLTAIRNKLFELTKSHKNFHAVTYEFKQDKKAELKAVYDPQITNAQSTSPARNIEGNLIANMKSFIHVIVYLKVDSNWQIVSSFRAQDEVLLQRRIDPILAVYCQSPASSRSASVLPRNPSSNAGKPELIQKENGDIWYNHPSGWTVLYGRKSDEEE
ncbi:hypothetical protein DdX_21994 [Ditylenchus destructor]|uniref:Uncharacterized protein n=1 Tax=Ditylenchus destructor TaxID=166010 RepID=A0AAD4QUS6_9BILA|nr:hypothetical protein DdX_21994 [Ditylenchus destructor]